MSPSNDNNKNNKSNKSKICNETFNNPLFNKLSCLRNSWAHLFPRQVFERFRDLDHVQLQTREAFNPKHFGRSSPGGSGLSRPICLPNRAIIQSEQHPGQKRRKHKKRIINYKHAYHAERPKVNRQLWELRFHPSYPYSTLPQNMWVDPI